MPESVDLPTPYDAAHAVREARRGSQSAFARLYRRFLPLVHGILISRMRPALADELTQECFALAFARLDQLHDPSRFGAWIATIARRMPIERSCETSEEALHDATSATASPDERAEAEHVLRALALLPEAYRETLALRLVEGMSGPEIAAVTGLTPESVRVNLHRGMEKLRAALDASPRRDPPGDRP